MAVEKIQATDSLNDGRVKLNAAIEQSNEAITKATTANENASQAVTTANSVQEQFNQVVIEGDSSVEAAQARVSANGVVYSTLKERLDKTIILSSSEPDKAEFWYEDKGEAPVNFNPDSGVSVINAVISDNPPSDNSKLWFDVEEA